MEQVLVTMAEKTIIGAGFFYLLYYLIKNMELITENLGDFGCTLKEISNTLTKIDMRVEQLEGRVHDLEREDDCYGRNKEGINKESYKST